MRQWPIHRLARFVVVPVAAVLAAAGCSSGSGSGSGSGGGQVDRLFMLEAFPQGAYLLEFSAPVDGGSVTGTVTLAKACFPPTGPKAFKELGHQTVTGTYEPRAVSQYPIIGTEPPRGLIEGTHQITLSASDLTVGGQASHPLGGLPSPVQGVFTPDGNLILGDTQDWTPVPDTATFRRFVANTQASDSC